MSSTTSRQVFERRFSSAAIGEVAAEHTSAHTARGVDGIGFDNFNAHLAGNIELIFRKANSGNYKFSPYREKLILKGADSKPRRISIPTIRDRVVLRCLNNFLCEIFADCKPPHAHPIVSAAIRTFENATDADSFVKLDVKSFYDCIDHKILEAQVRKRVKHEAAVSLIVSAIKTPTGVKATDGKFNQIGVPQGLSISNVLASIYMQNFDNEFKSKLGISYHRYVDDILIRTPSNEASVFAELASKRLKRSRKLTVHPLGSGKSEIIPHNKTLSYLGYSFLGKSVSVREASVKRMMTSLMRIIGGINDNNVEKSIWRLNIRISGCRIDGGNIGWLFYFSQINDRKVLKRLDRQVQSRLASIGRPELYSRCKTFIKAHREIKHNHDATDYVFDFDKFDRDGMLNAIYLIKPDSAGKLGNRTDEQIKSIFFKTMYREAREMERDTLGSFS
ncbi:reverse transcriptase domain-containing protein [Paracoccus sp. KR1-242]|uniref:reverse transcriptase domain-containing protein n=1 Tax=Paracoccus sp. KR1-242 TaxID=3410028 RepID=UPI003BFE2FD2